ncbi:ABC transporter [Pedobacter sp. KBW06]|uniref:Gldg family protein n=1 Tax=Pedobacter sp. KBW06 TaxID=2153359 RepID=UPI000F59D773|nr:Gldg family protein [Pedobacter sp. KBW06]RQO75637.1 ABC transporter [Pedobacter sp. KBW06]
MRTTLRIAITEVRLLFYSPIAWFMLIAFLIQTAIPYVSKMESYDRAQELKAPMMSITMSLFSIPIYGLFQQVAENLYLYLPLLTMGLISREISSNSIKLLYSSPVKISEIIFGKFFAIICFNFLLVAGLGLFVFAAYFTIEYVDVLLLLSGLFGIFLLLGAYASIGLFMSCLTSYQVVAAIGTFVVFAFLNYIGYLWQDIDFVRDLTYFLSISGRSTMIIFGLISTKDVIYFLVIMAVFLSASIIKLQDERNSKPIILKLSRYFFVLFLALFIGYFTSRPAFVGYFDTTRNSSLTISKDVQKILKELPGPLEITMYVNLLDETYMQGQSKFRNSDMDRWERYTRFKPDLEFKYVYYYDEPAGKSSYLYKSNPGKTLKQMAETKAKAYKLDLSYFKTPEEIRTLIDLKPERNRLVMQLKYKRKSTFLRTFDDNMFWPGSSEIAAAFKVLTDSGLSKIAFLDGEYERGIDKLGDRGYNRFTIDKEFRFAMINQGFDVEQLNLQVKDIPSDIIALVIADPRKEFTPEVESKIRNYIKEGGNLLVTAEPGKQVILSPILKDVGIQIKEGTLVQPTKEYTIDFVLPYLTPASGKWGRDFVKSYKDSVPVSTSGVAALDYSKDGNFKVESLLMSDANKSWNKKGRLVLDSTEVFYNSVEGDEKGSFPVALSLTRKIKEKEQRIAVIGDADLMANGVLLKDTKVKTGNFKFNIALFSWFNYGRFPVDVSTTASMDNHVLTNDFYISILKIIFLVFFPGLLLISGSVLLIRRKRK